VSLIYVIFQHIFTIHSASFFSLQAQNIFIPQILSTTDIHPATFSPKFLVLFGFYTVRFCYYILGANGRQC